MIRAPRQLYKTVLTVEMKLKQNSSKTVLKWFCISFVSVSFQLRGQFKLYLISDTTRRLSLRGFTTYIPSVPSSWGFPARGNPAHVVRPSVLVRD